MPHPTTANSWNQQRQINRAIEQYLLEKEAEVVALEAAVAAAEADLAALQADIDTQIAYLGEDCAGGDCGATPPFGECGNCTSNTQAEYDLDFAGVDLDATAYPGDGAYWDSYLNSNAFVLAQTAACTYEYLDSSVSEGGLESIKFVLEIEGSDYRLTITGYEGAGGTGAAHTLLDMFTVEADHTTGAAPGNCSQMPATTDHWEFLTSGSPEWSFLYAIGQFSITLAGGTFNTD